MENKTYLESPSLQDIKQAARNIASKAIKSPLVKLNQRLRDGNEKDIKVRLKYFIRSKDDIHSIRFEIIIHWPKVELYHICTEIKGPEIYLKLENLQPIGSFKVRPAVNAISCIDDQERLRKSGVCTASAGNFAQGLQFYHLQIILVYWYSV